MANNPPSSTHASIVWKSLNRRKDEQRCRQELKKPVLRSRLWPKKEMRSRSKHLNGQILSEVETTKSWNFRQRYWPQTLRMKTVHWGGWGNAKSAFLLRWRSSSSTLPFLFSVIFHFHFSYTNFKIYTLDRLASFLRPFGNLRLLCSHTQQLHFYFSVLLFYFPFTL